ncbi:30S ribosomal protein S1 [Leclercia adecarboxylata]|uniref:30S ribosomal protein S1 n=1 Tax=Leclercia adecarboxylata TaxID=83655 RepID=A0A4V6JN40_9ENTR|nr:30S ribosomal protein S1 [Leclercia adecarboxylata]
MGNSSELRNLKAVDFTDEQFGVPTVSDIIKELEKPGRDPRPEFKTATFADGVETMNDLLPGMVLEGAVTNVTNFGAFVDIGRASGWSGPYLLFGRQVRGRPTYRGESR